MEPELFYDKKTGWERMSDADKKQMQEYAEGYKAFLNEGKTERDAVAFLKAKAESLGFKQYQRNLSVKAGDKYYSLNRDKSIILAVIGKQSLSSGFNLTAAHLDAPRIDIRTVPLYEDNGMAFFKTHYYGGIKKYQWTTIPLELRGVVCRVTDDGIEKINVRIGDNPDDPLFIISDLLIHLATDQMQKSLMKGISAEKMNVLIGSEPSSSKSDINDKIKLAVMEYLNQAYGITEEDFLSADLCCVPAFSARDIGFDRSFIGAYGHDDRVCSYPAATALFDLKDIPEKTCITALVDKEEIGSDGVTGMQSHFFDTFVSDICRAQNVLPDECLENSTCLSADVCNAFDPNYPEVSENRNDARANCGLAIIKYTGSRGKSGSSEASSELMARIRYIFRQNDIIWQTGQLGKVDQGGGGTVAKFMANRNIDTVDAGVPVLCMHAPYEVIAKLDLFAAYRGFGAFYGMK